MHGFALYSDVFGSVLYSGEDRDSAVADPKTLERAGRGGGEGEGRNMEYKPPRSVAILMTF